MGAIPILVVLALVAAAAARRNGEALPDVDWSELPDVNGNGNGNGNGRVDVKPDVDENGAPIIEGKEIEVITWPQRVEALVRQEPSPGGGHFWQVRGPNNNPLNAGNMARRVLAGPANTGSNRVRLIKCMTRVAWNRDRYGSGGGDNYWRTTLDADGMNLSMAWLPRNAPALQFMANGQFPPRTISEATGGHIPGMPTGYFGLLWIPRYQATANTFVCDPDTAGPPGWLLEGLGG